MNKMIYIQTNLGKIGIIEDGVGITNLFFKNQIVPQNIIEEKTPLLLKAEYQIRQYLKGERKIFDLSLSLKGTDFQIKDWNALLDIPYGETRTYKDIAIKIGNPKSCRAVGLANHKNPISIIIPCHRVIGTNGKLTGYGGGIQIKKYLLEIEKKYK